MILPGMDDSCRQLSGEFINHSLGGMARAIVRDDDLIRHPRLTEVPIKNGTQISGTFVGRDKYGDSHDAIHTTVCRGLGNKELGGLYTRGCATPKEELPSIKALACKHVLGLCR